MLRMKARFPARFSSIMRSAVTAARARESSFPHRANTRIDNIHTVKINHNDRFRIILEMNMRLLVRTVYELGGIIT